MIRHFVVHALGSILLFSCVTHACTTAVISGRVTVDGRPMMWKNRDTWQRNNELIYDSSGKYPFVGVVNVDATERVRMGTNSMGLCIQNAVSRDLAPKPSSGLSNGEFLKVALQSCATVCEVFELLEITNKVGRCTRGSFGVIDAEGSAVMIEIGNHSFSSFDANDPVVAPQGFIVRANSSQSATNDDSPNPSSNDSSLDSIYSGERFARATELFAMQLKKKPIDLKFLLHVVARDIDENSLHFSSGSSDAEEDSSECPITITTSQTLNRCNTVSAVVFQGVLPGESPSLSTMWTILGEPMFSLAIPTWPAQSRVAEETNGTRGSRLCDLAVKLRRYHYNSSNRQLRTVNLRSATERLADAERQLLDECLAQLDQWREAIPTHAEFDRVHEEAVGRAVAILEELCSGAAKCFEKQTSQEQEATSFVALKFSLQDRLRQQLRATTAHCENATISPQVRVRGGNNAERGFLVVEIGGWEIKGSHLGEQVRFGFTSRSQSSLQTAAVLLERTANELVTLRGLAFGDGSSPIPSTVNFPAKQNHPITLVLELDKASLNPDEGETGGIYRVHYRESDESKFKSLEGFGKTRRRRSGNEIHVLCEGLFTEGGEHVDVKRIYFTTDDSILN